VFCTGDYNCHGKGLIALVFSLVTWWQML